jgi:antitoxin component of MazEF toxin-antitoxin module
MSMMIKHLVQHGNSKAIIIDKSILQAAGLDDNALFQIVVDSNSGITIQSVKPINSKFEEAKNHVFKEYAELFKRLSDR